MDYIQYLIIRKEVAIVTNKVIAVSADYGYINQITATTKSIFYHNDHVKLYVINSDIPQEWFSNINNRLSPIKGQVINLHIDEGVLAAEHVSQPQINQLSYGRILIPHLLDEDIVLYLDCDAVVNDNLDVLFQLPLGEKPLAAVPDVIYNGNFNSGVMLLNNRLLKSMKPDIVDQMLEYGQQDSLLEGDQSVLNHFFSRTYLPLGYQFNYVIGYDYFNYYGYPQGDLLARLSGVKPVIIHYTGPLKPWQLTSAGRMRDYWWRYANLEWGEINQHLPLPAVLDYQERGQVFTFTSTENLLHLEELVQVLPEVTFNVAAWTTMGGNLLRLLRYSNVHLYPNVVGPVLSELEDTADIYLDINYGGKEMKVIDNLPAHRTPILGFRSTMDDHAISQGGRVFEDDEVESMISTIKQLVNLK